MVNFKEHIITGNRPKSERALRAALKVIAAYIPNILNEKFLNFYLTHIWRAIIKHIYNIDFKIGSAVEAAVERFVVVGETIADENPDIQPEMYDACQEARSAGRFTFLSKIFLLKKRLFRLFHSQFAQLDDR